MTALHRIRVALTGFAGQPGVATHYALDGPGQLPSVHALWASLADHMPTTVHIQVENTGDIIEDTTGVITGAWAGAVQTPLGGGDNTAYPAPAGAILTWDTPTVLDGRRVKGRTFIVPMGGTSYSGTGTINVPNATALGNAASLYSLAVPGNAVLWHRPRAAVAAVPPGPGDPDGRPAKAQRPGGHAIITNGRCDGKTVVLRTRRD